MTINSRRTARIVLVLLAVSLALVLVSYAYIGRYARFEADDFCYTFPPWTWNFWSLERYMYLYWTGRFSTVALWWVSYKFGSGISQVAPSLAIVLWLAAMYWTIGQLPSSIGLSRTRALRFVVAEAFVALALVLNGSRGQTLYWFNGVVPYLTPLVCFTVLCGLMLRICFRHGSLPASCAIIAFGCVLAFLAAGFSETYLVFQFGMAAIAASALALRRPAIEWKNGLVALCTVLAGTALAGVITVLAPGNRVRFGISAGHHYGLLSDLLLTARAEALLLVLAAPPLLIALALAPGIPALHAFCRVSASTRIPVRAALGISRRWLAAGCIAGALIQFAVIFPSVAANATLPPARVLTISQFVYVCGLAIWICLAARQAQQERPDTGPEAGPPRTRWTAILVLSVLACLGAVLVNVERGTAWQAYAANWDARANLLQHDSSNGQLEVVTPALHNPSGISSAGRNPKYWVNVCTAQYYHLSRLTATTSAGKPPGTSTH